MIDVNALTRDVFGTLAGIAEWAAVVLRGEESRYARAEVTAVRSVDFAGNGRPVEGVSDARAA